MVSTVICTLILSIGATAQQANLNLEGFVRDEATGTPVGAKMYIFTPSGKRISINSNSKDGSYLQTLAESGPHKIAIAGYNVYRKEEIVNIPASEKFKIIKQDFLIKTLVQGSLISTTANAFDKNAASVTEQGAKALADLGALLKTNQSMNVVLFIAADEDRLAAAKAANDAAYKKAYDAWVKASKKVKKGQAPPVEPIKPVDPEDPNKSLIQERIDTLKTRLRPVKNGDVRIKYTYEPFPAQPVQSVAAAVPEPAPVKGGKKKPAAPKAAAPVKVVKVSSLPQLVIKVGVVKDLMD
ncbi:MAG: hypothetical protein ACK45E_09075 [Ignavibacteria bacterium]|jgi:hypothetical protein